VDLTNDEPYFTSENPEFSLQVLASGTYNLADYEDPDINDILTLTILVDGSTSYPAFIAVMGTSLVLNPTSNDQAGSYTVKVTVTDSDSAGSGTLKSDSSSFEIEIESNPDADEEEAEEVVEEETGEETEDESDCEEGNSECENEFGKFFFGGFVAPEKKYTSEDKEPVPLEMEIYSISQTGGVLLSFN
jgi:hypothetical protein